MKATINGFSLRAFFFVLSIRPLPRREAVPLAAGVGQTGHLDALVRSLADSCNVNLKNLEGPYGAAVVMKRVYRDQDQRRRVSRQLHDSLDHMNVCMWHESAAGNTHVRRVDVQVR